MPKDTNTNNVGSTNANKLFDIPLHLQPGQINTLAFAQDSISSMRMTPKGELEISFRDGSKVAIADFNELADSVKSCGRDTVIQLSDNTIIYPDQLRDQLAEKGAVDFVGAQADGLMILDEPRAGQILTKNIESGHEYKLNFSLDNVNAAQSGPNLLLTFKDGGVLVLNNYFIAVHSDLPPAMTLADGATIDSNELLTSCKLVEIPNTAESVVASAPQSGLRESVSDVEPAAGEEKSAVSGARDVAKAAQPSSVDVANIEPAAGGEGAARVSGSSRGYGFGSSIDGAPFREADAIGPIAPTALNYGAPQISTIPYVAGSVSAAPNDIPTSNGGTAFVDETNIPSVSGAVVIDYGIDGPGTVALNTSFRSDYPMTSGGVPVLVSLSGNTYTGLANGVPVFTLTLNASTGAYTFTQLKNIDHANSNDPNDSLGLSFGVTATDRDGDQINTSIAIQIRDDGPLAVDDSNFLLENQQSVSGNILTNDDPGADGLGALKTVSFNGQDYPVPTTGFLTVLGVYGTLQISASGAYSYTSANAGIGVDSFSYVIGDGDGDSSTGRFTLEVRDVDYQPIVVNAEATLDETGIAGDGRESVSGTVAVNFQGDGAGSVDATGSFSAGGSLKAGGLSSNGVPVVVTMAGDVYTGKAGNQVVFTLVINNDGTYQYTQFAGLDHADAANANDVITLNFGMKATDADGDTTNGTILVRVLDDAPVVVNDTITLATAPGSVTGNVLSNDTVGTDGASVKVVTFGGTTVNVPATGTVTIVGSHGTLIIGADGAYTYTGTAVGNDVFGYRIEDGDGDGGASATGQLTVTVLDVDYQPIVVNAEATLDETGIAGDGRESVSGTVAVNFQGDGAGSVDATGSFSAGGSLKAGGLSSNGVPVVVTMAGDVYTGKAGNLVVFTLVINNDGTYQYTQFAGLDHADAANANDVITLNFGMKATDADGDTTNGTILVRVLDDAPVVVNDTITLATAPGSVTGNVLSNDTVGTDGASVKVVTFGGTTVNVPATGTVTIVGSHGTLIIGADGAYTYTGTAVGNDVFGYRIEDGDGDGGASATGQLTVTVLDVDYQPIVVNAEATLDETGIAGDGRESVSGTVAVNFQGDGAGSVDATGSFSAGGSLKAGGLSSNGVPVVVTMAGDVYTGKAGNQVVFTLVINNDGTYQYTQFAGLDHADAANANDVITLNFGMKATDADGDTTNGTILVRVLDDAPVVVNDMLSLPSTSGFFSANVLSNDRAGIDGATLVTKVTLNGVDYQIAPTGSTTISGQHGTLVMRADGYYTYSPTQAGVDHFTYTVVDRDGDRSSASLDFDIFDIKSKVVVDLNVNNGVESVCIKEDTSIVVPVSANVTGGDGDEVITLTVTGVGANWGFLGTGWSQVSSGVYSIALPVGQTNYNGSFKLTPPLNSDVDLNGLKITASVFDPDFGASEINQKNFNISVDAVADIPTVSVNLPTYTNTNPWVETPYYNYQYCGFGNESAAFNIKGILTDADGSERITHYTIEMHKSLADLGVKFSAGTEVSPGLWRIEPGQEVGLKIVFPYADGSDISIYQTMQGIHTMNVTAHVSEVNLSGNECDTTDNTSLNCVPIQVVILASPLAVDLNGDGVHLTDANNGVYFDINGDGISDKTGWVDQNDGLLALDKDHNGLIEGQGELFGGNIEDGFSVLARYDDNTDGLIDQNDSVWKDLVIWQDANHDGVSQNGELISLDDLDFSSISLNSQSVEYYVSGNKISAESTITKSDGTSTQIVDAWFAFYNGADADQMAEAKSNESSQSALAFNQESHNTQPVVIADFDSQVDKIDLSSLIDTGSVVGDAINDFVFSRTENGSTIISVDASGSGSASAAVDVVVLKDVIINHVDDIVEIAHQQQQQSGFGTV